MLGAALINLPYKKKSCGYTPTKLKKAKAIFLLGEKLERMLLHC